MPPSIPSPTPTAPPRFSPISAPKAGGPRKNNRCKIAGCRLNQPTRVRYLVVSLATAMSVLLYLDRICISFLERFIREDLQLSNDQASWLLSAFFWAYALGQVPAGWLSDRFGAR